MLNGYTKSVITVSPDGFPRAGKWKNIIFKGQIRHIKRDHTLMNILLRSICQAISQQIIITLIANNRDPIGPDITD